MFHMKHFPFNDYYTMLSQLPLGHFMVMYQCIAESHCQTLADAV